MQVPAGVTPSRVEAPPATGARDVPWWRVVLVVLPLLAACVPPALVARQVARYGVDVPVWDQWQFAGLVVDAAERRLDASAIWAQHNEHRLVVPRLVMLALAAASRWNVRWELAANVVLAGCTLLLLVLLLRDTVGRRQPALVPWLVLAASCMTFSPAQWENWLWGWQLQIFLAVFVATAIAFVLARWRGGWAGIALLVPLAWADALCFASGTAMLVLVPVAVLVHPSRRPWARRAAQAVVALALGLALLAVYLHGYVRPGHHPPPLEILAEPRPYLEYVTAYLGAALGYDDVWAAIYWGSFAIVFLAVAGTWLAATGDWPILAPWAFLAANAIGSGAVTGIGRGRFGAVQALVSRYVTISAPVWICVAVVGALLLARAFRRRDAGAPRALAAVALASALVTLAAQGWARTWAAGAQSMVGQHRDQLANRECLLGIERAPESCVAKLFAATTLVRDSARRLAAHRLGVFRPGVTPAMADYAVVGAPGAGGWLERAVVPPAHPDRVRVAGWALDPDANGPPQRVLVVGDGQPLGIATTGIHRPDVAQVTGQRRMRHSGWTFRFASFRLGPGTHRLEAYAIVGDGTKLVPLAGATDLTLP